MQFPDKLKKSSYKVCGLLILHCEKVVVKKVQPHVPSQEKM